MTVSSCLSAAMSRSEECYLEKPEAEHFLPAGPLAPNSNILSTNTEHFLSTNYMPGSILGGNGTTVSHPT